MHHLFYPEACRKAAGMPSNGFLWMVHRPNLDASAATWDTRRLPSMFCARRVADAPSMHNPGGGGCEGGAPKHGSQARERVSQVSASAAASSAMWVSP